ncbi:UDP-N-acetylglucosamine 1-carboxyvinyltransferase,UDP-N-acetylglucosamine 1-carboxyvinyltransferase,5-enolpyruvylshikimate-3-phosphate synthase,UDP-N-acetylglucosamine 1-carboxyvinyltransferase,EPSP synthase (3-phosphoshikimate 1-carboxyvinyltransferase) [Chlamydia serpentis]|uniref:UDP-N-acetylglucosamine 1-carboxyvinyltransferase n=1 Tax=Chlamydia serpentis TaxID=1967782 RepID=A0A2R8FB72_9CHLA|nr:UDP-N-acetylglucosamine 1-carboxyvinyltransferase [Chlamydia serpentis]SPN73690.1 UDP-N-acetylglucosamine 1-carboxyvinyltransferase,UDP-N-acetylglucosamine 1-carboxyvinyltransferase,5-enolpyruvylshikimate-3-phosphate synthase,UDP-N-acetylglucosamine 1-carboxyvinyltransferase,EPSP synthase (3-phosphoshikimate 1-carboxyvinyltransferase) [Chlamydia serpentis]
MQVAEVFGGGELNGEVRISGAKNSATKLLVASMLSDQKCTLRNVPDIGDVSLTVELCESLGAQVIWDKESEILEIQTPQIQRTKVSPAFSNVNRIPILLLGALLGRCPEGVHVPVLGGDAIGKRTLNFHFEGLKRLGVDVSCDSLGYYARAPQGLQGNYIKLPYPSVGATENLILAAIYAKGRTVIRNAALEAEILDLVLFLQKAGADITTDNDRTIDIFGVDNLSSVDHTILPDKIEAASFGMAAIASGGRVFVRNARQELMIPFLKMLRSIGGGFLVAESGIEFYQQRPLTGGVVLETDVHPGFLTDWQQPFAVLLSQAQGSSVIHETVHENRLGYLYGLQQMGAKCQLFHQCLSAKECRYVAGNFPHSAVIHGATSLKASHLVIPDLRAGFAYVMAALIAEGGYSVIENTHLLDRGYTNWVGKLRSLGARIEIFDTECNQPTDAQESLALRDASL